MKLHFFKPIICLVSLASIAAGANSKESGVLELSPRQMLSRVYSQNFDFIVQQLEVDISRDQEIVATEELSPVLSIQVNRDSSQRAQNQREFLGTGGIRIFDEDTLSTRAGISKLFSTGMQLELEAANLYLKNTSNREPESGFFPEFQSTTRLSLTQPLMRGRGENAVLASRNVQKINTQVSEWETRATFEQLTARLLFAAWENHFAIENIKVKEEAIEVAQQLADENRRRVEQGLMAEIDVTQAEVRVAEAREELIAARSFYRDRQRQLWDLISDEAAFSRPSLRIVDLDRALPELSANRDEIVRQLIEWNPAYQAVLAQAEAENIRVRFAENQSLPQVDLRASIGYNGLDDFLGGSIRDFKERDGPDWGVGLVFSVPLDREVYRARVRVAQQTKRQTLVRLKQTERDLFSTLEQSLQRLKDTEDLIELVGESVRLAEEGLRAEERRLERGLTTTFNVLNQQRELSQARTRELAARIDREGALLDVRIIKGTLSRDLGFAFRP